MEKRLWVVSSGKHNCYFTPVGGIVMKFSKASGLCDVSPNALCGLVISSDQQKVLRKIISIKHLYWNTPTGVSSGKHHSYFTRVGGIVMKSLKHMAKYNQYFNFACLMLLSKHINIYICFILFSIHQCTINAVNRESTLYRHLEIT